MVKTQRYAPNCFKRNSPKFDPIKVREDPVFSVTSEKLVGVSIQHDLKWDENTDAIQKKAQKRYISWKSWEKPVQVKKTFSVSIQGLLDQYAVPSWVTSRTYLIVWF